MEHGGSYERDAAVGGYDRKELRGLSKQAKRGTLTQRERARYKYLKDERGGRRKRGLLSGLGGAAAALGGLAAAGKLGQGGDGNGVMEFFRNKLKGDKRQVNEMEPTGNIENPAQEVFEDVPSDLEQEAVPSEPRNTPGAERPPSSTPITSEGPVREESPYAPGAEYPYSRGGDNSLSGIEEIPLEEEEDGEDRAARIDESSRGFLHPRTMDGMDEETLSRIIAMLSTTPKEDYKSRPGASVNRGKRMIDQIFNRYN